MRYEEVERGEDFRPSTFNLQRVQWAGNQCKSSPRSGVSGRIASAHCEFVIPGSRSIHADAFGVVAVAILTTSVAYGDPLDFDALDVDETTLAFGPAGAPIPHVDDHAKDADGDGDLDMLVHFDAQETGLTCDDTTAALTGRTYGGEAITGTDFVTIMNGSSGS